MEVAKMVKVLKAAIMKDTIRRRDSRAKQIGVEEDTVKDIIPTFNATNDTNMVTMRMIVTSTNITIMVEWGMLQKIVELIKMWKEKPDGVNITHAEAIWILGSFRTSIIVNN